MKIRRWLALALLLTACSSSGKPASAQEYPTLTEQTPSSTPSEIRLPEASGNVILGDSLIQIDASHIDQGYIMVKTLSTDHRRLKLKIMKDGEEYPYDIDRDGEYITYPLTQGSGQYELRGYENIEGTRYAVLFKQTLDVQLAEETLPYLYPNQIVNYTPQSASVLKSFDLTQTCRTELERVLTIYNYVVGHVSYDWDKVEKVKDQYVLPIVDETLAEGKGICFDYAALMSAMLRVQQIPTRLITGYVDEGYHAWVEVYVRGAGWINPEIYFEKETWTRMDPTYASTQMKYKGEYHDKYRY
ncbi:transglutaminase-like domain-containing protein [Holdemania massiliensis]|uniref:transglutaminase-like domain-containing protein n=1 Tax=Holdemania massiliensis TaxID=1468449 RepID=UPI003565403F